MSPMRFRLFVVSIFLVLFIILTACTMSVGMEKPLPSSSDQVATVVAQTMQASTPQVAATLLPHSLYYLGADSQVYRMQSDGKTIKQLTSETGTVSRYDVSPVDGSIAYGSANQLLLVDTDGANRRVLAEGADHPIFSPDGKTLAYRRDGISLYSISTGSSNPVLEDNPLGGTNSEPPVIYIPESFSPDGTKLLIAMATPPDGPMASAIYSLADKSLIKFVENPDVLTCCSFYGGPVWSADGSTLYGIASLPDSSYKFGELWKVNTSSGAVTKVIATTDTTVNLPKELFSAPDGQLYYFFGSYTTDSGFFDSPTLQLVSSKAEEGAVLIFKKEENFAQMNEALWAPDASFVIIVSTASQEASGNGQAEIVYLDGRPNVQLAQSVRELKWGP